MKKKRKEEKKAAAEAESPTKSASSHTGHDSSDCEDREEHYDKFKKDLDKDTAAKIDISTSKYEDFEAHMSGIYGEQAFKDGFHAVKKNRDLLFLDSGTQKLAGKISHLIPDKDKLNKFIAECM